MGYLLGGPRTPFIGTQAPREVFPDASIRVSFGQYAISVCYDLDRILMREWEGTIRNMHGLYGGFKTDALISGRGQKAEGPLFHLLTGAAFS
jgi:hypothetical protein